MLSSTVFASLLSATTALALPHGGDYSFIDRAMAASKVITNVKLPQSSLAEPPAEMSLKYVVAGYGTQNYTCSSTPNSASSPPTSAGAKAQLYDASTILGASSSAQDMLQTSLPPLVLSLGQTFDVTPDQFPAPVAMNKIGDHFFAPGGIPTFHIDAASPSAQIGLKKDADVPAPDGAFAGMSNEGAVAWLQLSDNQPDYTSTVLAGGSVYRVETAGGTAPATCEGLEGDVTVPYAALYYFYGPN